MTLLTLLLLVMAIIANHFAFAFFILISHLICLWSLPKKLLFLLSIYSLAFLILVLFWVRKFSFYTEIEEDLWVSKQRSNYSIVQSRSAFYLWRKNDWMQKDSVYQIRAQIKKLPELNRNDFLFAQNVFYEIKTWKILATYKAFSFQHLLQNYLSDAKPFYERYMNLFLLNWYSSKTQDLVQNLQNYGILHLVVISGLHLNFLRSFFEKIFKFLKLNKDQSQLLIITIFISLFFFLGFKVSLFRIVSVAILLFIYQKIFKKKLASEIVLLISAACLLIFNAHIFKNWGFVFSYVITLILVLLSKIKFKNRLQKAFAFQGVAYLSALPLVLFYQKKFIIWAFFLQIFFLFWILLSFFLAFFGFFLKDFLNFYFQFLDSLFYNLKFMQTSLMIWSWKFWELFSWETILVFLIFIKKHKQKWP